MKKLLIAACFALVFAFPLSRPAQALGPLIDSSVLSDTDCVGPSCQYSLNTFMKLGINVANIILGIVGAVALVVFVYGGIRMMASGGNAESVSAGKKSIVGAVIGLLLVFGSYSLISFTVNNILKADKGYQFNGNINAEVPAVVSAHPKCAEGGGTCKTVCTANVDISLGTLDCNKGAGEVCCKASPKEVNECANNNLEGCVIPSACLPGCGLPSKSCTGFPIDGSVCCKKGGGCSL